MYKIKDVARRGSALLGAVGLLTGIGTSMLPAFASADALNPLTERSLTLSSSSPGWSYLDGSGNIKYAPPHSGANGQKTGDTFSYRMSSFNKTVKAITFQYCTTPAGSCTSPGNNTIDPILNSGATTATATGTITLSSGSPSVTGSGTSFTTELNVGAEIVTAGNHLYTVQSITNNTALTLTANASASEAGVAFKHRNADGASTSDLNVHVGSGGTAAAEIGASDWSAVSNSTTTPSLTPPANNTTGDGDDRPYVGNFVVLYHNHATAPSVWGDYTQSTGWSMATSNDETGTLTAGTATGRNNLITITNSGGQALNSTDPGDYFKVIFFGTDDNYITNPGAGAFFVRMNTYNDTSTLDSTTLIDGGVTVANVMNESISIQTKVLETMDFSVGTHDPDTYNDSVLSAVGQPIHGQCNTLLMADPQGTGVTNQATYDAQPHNVLHLGDPNAEYSLKTNLAYDVNSYWRLSSNSSGGATVYYTGHTLTNTVGDEIAPLNDTTGGGTASNTGTEQFGLALAQDGAANYLVNGDAYGSHGTPGDFADYVFGQPDVKVHLPRLAPLVPYTNYGNGAGTITSGGTAKFAFNAHADTYAIPLATESTDVVNCVTAKMRYVANIAATTPAGIYTTKVNYVASPQY